MPFPVRAALFAFLSALGVLGWWLPNRPDLRDLAMPAERFNSVSFAPYRPGQSPLTHVYPTPAEVDADLALVAARTRAVRTYASLEGGYDLPAMAARHGLKVWLGVWLGADRARNAKEIAGGIALARAHPETVERVVVGNEVLLRRDLPPAELAAAIDQVRAALPPGIKVTYADVWEFWEQFPAIADHVDIVTIHLLPYWEDVPTNIDAAVAQVGAVYRRMVARFPGKPVAIGETGWPSGGRWRRDAAPGRVNEAAFLRRFIALSMTEGFDYNLIEAFDQVWKAHDEGTVGARWGFWTSDRVPKFPMSGPVVEDPDWPFAAALGVAAGAVLAAIGRAGGARRLVLAAALGQSLAFAVHLTLPMVLSPALAAAAAGNLLGQAALAILLMRPDGATRRDYAEATQDVRALLRGRLPARAWLLDDLLFLFAWTATVLQLLLLFDPRYRDFPLPCFAVPLVAVCARAWPRGGGRAEATLGLVLAAAAIGSAVREGPLNLQSLIWNAAALLLAAPPLASLLRPAGGTTSAQAPSAAPSSP